MSDRDGRNWVNEVKLANRRPTVLRRPKGRLTGLVAAGVMVISLAVLLIPYGNAQAATGSLRLSPLSGTPGTSVKIVGSAFPSRTRLQVTWDGASSGMPSVQVSGVGTFKTTIIVPRAPAGSHTVAVVTREKGMKSQARREPIAGATFIVALGAASAAPTATSLATPVAPPTLNPATPAPSPTFAAPPPATPVPTPTLAPPPPPTSAPTSTAAPTSSASFVRASGTQLTLDGQPYRFKGFNIYNANSRDNCWYSLGRDNGALGDALAAVGPGQNAFRAWFFQDLATTDGVRDWSAFDHTLAVARAHNVRVIATLADQWGHCDSGTGNPAEYKPESWYTNGYRTSVSAGSTVAYRAWVAEIVTRYRDDPTILAWQLMNEAEIKPGITNGCSIDAATTLRTWATDISGLVKSLDANHLVSLGTIGTGQCGAQGSEYQSVHALPGIDLCEYHDYGLVAMPGDQWNGLAVRLSQCATLGKPIFVGETGQKDLSLTERASVFASKFSTQFAAGVTGELVWALRIESEGGSSTNNYDVGPSDPTVNLFAQY